MLQNAYFLAKIGADTAENERHFAEHLPKIVGSRSSASSTLGGRSHEEARLAALQEARALARENRARREEIPRRGMNGPPSVHSF